MIPVSFNHPIWQGWILLFGISYEFVSYVYRSFLAVRSCISMEIVKWLMISFWKNEKSSDWCSLVGCWWGDLGNKTPVILTSLFSTQMMELVLCRPGREWRIDITALAVYFHAFQVNGTVCQPYFYEYNVSLPTSFNITADTKYWIAIQEISDYSMTATMAVHEWQ